MSTSMEEAKSEAQAGQCNNKEPSPEVCRDCPDPCEEQEKVIADKPYGYRYKYSL